MPKARPEPVTMELHIKTSVPDERYVWKTVYNNTDIRDYELVVLTVTKENTR
jgi:hypothetical protein